VPTVIKTSQSAAALACATTSGSSDSPNQTTPGRIKSSQYGQRGGISGNVARSSRHRVGDASHPRQQLTSQIEPWRRIVSSVPADSCKPSTFCVINLNCGKRRLQSASTRCASLGSQAAMSDRRQAYHSQTRRGSRPNASAVASVSGRKFLHSPPAPRNVGTPLAAETPAPVRTVIRALADRRSQIAEIGLLINCSRRLNYCFVLVTVFFFQPFMNSKASGRFGTTTSVCEPPCTSR
jgi:hypothetical protein